MAPGRPIKGILSELIHGKILLYTGLRLSMVKCEGG